jgi:hypothetical protein
MSVVAFFAADSVGKLDKLLHPVIIGLTVVFALVYYFLFERKNRIES